MFQLFLHWEPVGALSLSFPTAWYSCRWSPLFGERRHRICIIIYWIILYIYYTWTERSWSEDIVQRCTTHKHPQFSARSSILRLLEVMLRNLPNNYTRDMFLSLLDEEGLSELYDFVYLPMDFCRDANLGYAFVNLVKLGSEMVGWFRVGSVEWYMPLWPPVRYQLLAALCHSRTCLYNRLLGRSFRSTSANSIAMEPSANFRRCSAEQKGKHAALDRQVLGGTDVACVSTGSWVAIWKYDLKTGWTRWTWRSIMNLIWL